MIPVEKEGETLLLSLRELEKRFSFSYLPRLDFLDPSYFSAFLRKTIRYRKKGLLDQEQIWLGIYFEKEILTSALPPVRLRWINEVVGWGVFAECDLKPLYYIGEYAGIVRKRRKKDEKNAYCFEYPIAKEEPTRYLIDAENQGGITRFINHSTTPNLQCSIATVYHIPHIIFFVQKPIRKGEQLFYDYGIDYWKKRIAPQTIDY